MLLKKTKKTEIKTSEMSVFIRDAKSRDKKKVYRRVIDKANKAQNEIVRKSV